MENNLVVKSNQLNESRYKLSVQEQRIVLAMTSMIEPGDTDFKPYSFTIQDFMNLVNLKGQSAYSDLKKVTKGLLKRVFTIAEPSGDLQIGWVSSAKYYNEEGRVELCFNPLLKPYLLALKKEFTRYQLKNTIRLKSIYSVRIYELLKQYQSIGSREFELNELRALLGLTGTKLSTYSNFKLRVLEHAKKELENTDILFTYEPVKTVRRITGIIFRIHKNKEVVKKSYKKKTKIQESQPDLDFKAKKDKAEQSNQEKLHKHLLALENLYPEMYEKLKQAAISRFTKKELTQRGHRLKVVFKMKSILPKFIQKYKIIL